MADTPTPEHLAAWRGMLTVHTELTERIDDALRRAEVIPLRWYDALLGLYEAPGHRLRLSELARAALLSRSGLSRLVDRLEAAGLLTREPCSDDARGAYAVLTPEGLQALRRSWKVYGRQIEALFGRHLSRAEARAAAELSRRVLDRLPESTDRQDRP